MKNSVYTPEQIEQYLINLGLLHFTLFEAERFLTSKELLIHMIVDHAYENIEQGTTLREGDLYDLVGGCRRSIGDIYRIAKYYSPSISFVDVYETLIKLIEENCIGSFICMNIGKRVYFPYDEGYVNGELIDEFHNELPEDFRAKRQLGYYGSHYTSFSLNFIKI